MFDFSAFIRAHMAVLDLSQEQYAAKMGYSRYPIGLWARGKEEPSREDLELIAATFPMSIYLESSFPGINRPNALLSAKIENDIERAHAELLRLEEELKSC